MAYSKIQHDCKTELNEVELRATPARIALLQLLETSDKPLDVQSMIEFLEKKEARKIDRFTQTALVASDQAVKDAGITKDNVDTDRVGVVFASGIGGLITFQEEVMNFAKGDG